LDAVNEYFSATYVRHSSEGDYDRTGFREIIQTLIEGFPDLSTQTVITVAEGNLVAYRWISTGTHLGTYLGVPPTHRTVTATGITISRLANRLIVEDWASWNAVTVLHSLGIIPIT